MLGPLEVRTVGPLTLSLDPAVTSDAAERAWLLAADIDDYADDQGTHDRFVQKA